MKKALRLILVLIPFLLFCGESAADQITLKNGDHLSGTILRADGKSLTLKTEYLGEISVPVEAIREVNSEQPFYVTAKDAATVFGKLESTDGKLLVRPERSTPVTVPKESLESIRSQAEQAAHERRLERLQHPHLLDFWSGDADAGMSIAQGNTNALTVTVGTHASRTTPQNRLSLNFLSLFSRNAAAGRNVVSANALRGGARYDVKLDRQLFAFGFADFEFDELQKLDLRNILGSGVGFLARSTPHVQIDLFAGGSFNNEFFSSGLERRSGEMLVGQEITFKANKRATFSKRLAYYPNMSQLGEHRLTFDSSASIQLSDRLRWLVTLSDRFISNPNPGTEKNDLLLTTGIRVNFGREEFGGFGTRLAELLKKH